MTDNPYKPFVGRLCKVFLSGKPLVIYSGKLLAAEADTITIKDKFGADVVINLVHIRNIDFLR